MTKLQQMVAKLYDVREKKKKIVALEEELRNDVKSQMNAKAYTELIAGEYLAKLVDVESYEIQPRKLAEVVTTEEFFDCCAVRIGAVKSKFGTELVAKIGTKEVSQQLKVERR
jgi:hypothetical protein